MLSRGFVHIGPRKVGSFGTALLTIIVTFTSVLGLAGCAGIVASNSTGSGTPSPLSITTTALPNAQAGTAYSFTLTATGGTTPYTWSVAAGSLPSGLTLNSSTGQLSGTPSQSGTFSFTAQVSDPGTTVQTATKALGLVVSATSTVSITTAVLPSGQVGTAYSATVAATGGSTPYSWSLAAGSSLPAGLSLNSSSGALTGTPSQAGTVSFTVQVKDSSSTAQTATKLFSVTIAAANPNSVSILTASIPNGQVGVAYSAALTAAGGTAPYTWSVAAGSLPAGVTLNSSTGLLSGTPTQAGAVSITVQVKDSSSTALTATKAFSATISPVGVAALSITTASLANGQSGVAYSATLAATGGTTPYSWSVATGSSLPAGLSLSVSSGALSGTPTQAGTFTFSVQVRDSSTTVQTAAKQYTISIAAGGSIPLSIVTTTLSNGQVNLIYSGNLSAKGGATPYHWSLLSGSLPAGLSLNASTGQISGTPTQTGSFPFQVQVTDSSSPAQTASQSFTLLISPPIVGTAVTSCGTLANGGATYVLQNDISSTGTCIIIAAGGITFDLNGHTITYDTAGGPGAGANAYGITLSNMVSGIGGRTHILSSVAGGTVKESTACYVDLMTAAGDQTSTQYCQNSHAIYVKDAEVDHLTIGPYYGTDDRGVYMYYDANYGNVHDNTIYPHHTKSVLNHYTVYGEVHFEHGSGYYSAQNNYIGGPNSTTGYGSEAVIYFGDPSPSQTIEVLNNTIIMANPVRDSYAIEIGCNTTNSSPTNTPFEFAYNTINQQSGRGIMVDTYANYGCSGGTIHDNVVSVKEAGNEGHSTGDAIAIQVRFGGFNVQVYNNQVNVNIGQGQCPAQFYTDNGSDCAGVGIKFNTESSYTVSNLVAYNNTVTTSTNNASFQAVGLYGAFTDDGTSSFHDNTVTSNSADVATDPGPGVTDGCGMNWIFQHNTFIKASNPQGFNTYQTLYFCNPAQSGATAATGNVFIDNIYQGGAAPDDIGSSGSNSYSYYVKWSYNVTVQNSSGQPVPGVTVSAVATGGGTETVSQVTDASGNAQLILTDHFVSGTSASSPITVGYTPHMVTVTATGCKVSSSPFQLTLHQTTNQTLVCQ